MRETGRSAEAGAMSDVLSTMTCRLDRLERRNRRLQGALAVILLLGGTVGVLGQAGPSGKTVEAERFVVRDAAGKVRAELGITDQGGAKLDLGTADGRRVAYLGGDGATTLFTLHGTTGSWNLSLGPPPLGNHLALLDADHSVRLTLGSGAAEKGAAGLELWDGSKRIRGRLLVLPTGDAALGFYDAAGQVRLSLDLLATDSGRLRFLDAAGHTALGLLLSQKRASGVILEGARARRVSWLMRPGLPASSLRALTGG
jgi:hypothetical protein